MRKLLFLLLLLPTLIFSQNVPNARSKPSRPQVNGAFNNLEVTKKFLINGGTFYGKATAIDSSRWHKYTIPSTQAVWDYLKNLNINQYTEVDYSLIQDAGFGSVAYQDRSRRLGFPGYNAYRGEMGSLLYKFSETNDKNYGNDALIRHLGKVMVTNPPSRYYDSYAIKFATGYYGSTSAFALGAWTFNYAAVPALKFDSININAYSGLGTLWAPPYFEYINSSIPDTVTRGSYSLFLDTLALTNNGFMTLDSRYQYYQPKEHSLTVDVNFLYVKNAAISKSQITNIKSKINFYPGNNTSNNYVWNPCYANDGVNLNDTDTLHWYNINVESGISVPMSTGDAGRAFLYLNTTIDSSVHFTHARIFSKKNYNMSMFDGNTPNEIPFTTSRSVSSFPNGKAFALHIYSKGSNDSVHWKESAIYGKIDAVKLSGVSVGSGSGALIQMVPSYTVDFDDVGIDYDVGASNSGNCILRFGNKARARKGTIITIKANNFESVNEQALVFDRVTFDSCTVIIEGNFSNSTGACVSINDCTFVNGGKLILRGSFEAKALNQPAVTFTGSATTNNGVLFDNVTLITRDAQSAITGTETIVSTGIFANNSLAGTITVTGVAPVIIPQL